MIKAKTKKLLVTVLAVVMVLVMLTPISVMARDWWIMEVTYTLRDRAPVTVTGPNSRIFLPDMIAASEDGIEMDMLYQVSKDGQILTDGEYAQGLYFDLTGAGTYTFTFTGVDASNSYTFEVKADEAYPSLVLDAQVPMSVYMEDPFNAPAAKISYGATEVDADVQLEMASGAKYKSEGKAIPESGLMTLLYTAQIDGKDFEFSYEIEVLDQSLGFYDESGAFYPAATRAYEDQELSGAILNSAMYKTYTYSEIIDLSRATKNDPLIVLNNAAVEAGSRTLPYVRIVDAYDPQNYIEIKGRWSADNNNVVYSVAMAVGQTLVGHQGGVGYYNQGVFGTETTFPTAIEASKSHPATYYYDAEEKAVYAGWYGSIWLVSDFDADYQMQPWEGFTTGEVYIEVRRSSEVDFICVQSVAGHSLEAVGRDPVGPVLTVDMGAYRTAPDAVAGTAYPIFDANAVDAMDSVLPVDIHVYKGCDATSGMELNIRDGAFMPYDAGYYTIVYSAADRFGNETVKKINVLALDAANAEAISAQIAGLPQNAYVGDKLSVPQPTKISGGSGNVSCQIWLVAPDGTETEITEDYVIIPAEGKNTVRYILTDYLGTTKTYSYDINCTVSKDPILYTLTMPEVLPSGKTFTLPAAEYAQDDSVEVTVTAALDGKPIDVVDNTVTAVTENAQAKLVLTYQAKNSTGSSSKEYTITVLGSNVADRTTFFQTVSGSFALEQKENSIGLTTTQSGSGVRFVNSILASKLNLLLSVDPEKNDSDRITVMLTDSMDPSVSVRLDIVKKPGGDDKSKSEFYINGTQVNDMVGNFYGGVATLGISYKKSLGILVDTEGNTLGQLNKTYSGEDFTGFPSGQVNVVISAGTVGANGFSFDVLQINNQTFVNGDMFFDNYPEIVINGTLQMQAELGQQIQVPTAFGSDVLSPNTALSLTIRKGMEKIVENQPLDEPYTFTLDDYGTYYVVYNYSDGSIERTVTYAIQSIEHNAPEAELPDGLPKKVKLNKKVEVPMPEATDDYAETVRISVIVREPNSNMILLNEEEMSFVADKAGTYTVIYYVYDDCYNYQMLEHEIEVTED